MCCSEKEESILKKSLELFSTYGIRSVSMDDISTNQGISKKTLYRFVKDKEELISKVVAATFKENSKRIESLLDPSFNAIEEVLAVVRFFTEMHQSHSANMIFDLQKFYPEIYSVFRKNRNEKLSSFFETNLKKGMIEGLYRENLDVNVVKRIIIHLSESIIESDNFTFEEITSPHFIKEMYSYHLHGIVSEKGHEFLNQELKKINK
ncbi:MAG: TetR/AcrR family transcriptional regulator [Bacteroidetes bacterium]|nr:TetR/AcrR family transcriptional regulator [Bacteroidota bacterium]